MSRIDEIKERLKESFPMDHNSLMKKIEWDKSDIMELIERLEVAEKALDKVFADQGFVYLRDALDEIRK